MRPTLDLYRTLLLEIRCLHVHFASMCRQRRLLPHLQGPWKAVRVVLGGQAEPLAKLPLSILALEKVIN